MSYFHIANATLSSALFRFTAEFGMGSGGTRSLWSSGGTGVDRLTEAIDAMGTSRHVTSHAHPVVFIQDPLGVIWSSLTGH